MKLSWVFVLFFGLAMAQVTPPEDAQSPVPSQDKKALKDVRTYWLENLPDTPLPVLQQLAGYLEKNIPGLTAAESRETAGMVIELRAEETMRMTTTGSSVLEYTGLVYCHGTLVWRRVAHSSFFSADMRIGENFGEWVAGKWKKANK